MIVVFDSNIWLKELGLRSGAGAAARFFLNDHGARLAVPEVVRLEVAHNLRTRLADHIESIRKDYGQLLTAFGTLRELVLPTDAEVQAKVEEVFASVDVAKLEVPFTLESARSSFLKTIEKRPPSDKTQEFKDGVLWSDCLGMLASDSVDLVTSDKAFYQDRQYEKGLAQNLQAEASHLPNKLRILPTLNSILESLRTPVTLNEDALADVFLNQYRESVYGMLARNGFDLGPRQDLNSTLFATENPNVLFLDFSMAFECTDIRGEGRTDATLRLKGDGSYSPPSGQFTNLRNFGEHLDYRMADGTERENKNVVVHLAGIVIGHKEVTNVVRYRLNGGGR
jgi:predicted nucleic acid-binding protein